MFERLEALVGKYEDLSQKIGVALSHYIGDVEHLKFPDAGESYE